MSVDKFRSPSIFGDYLFVRQRITTSNSTREPRIEILVWYFGTHNEVGIANR